MHSVMAHGDTVADTDGIELHRSSTCRKDAVLYGTGDGL